MNDPSAKIEFLARQLAMNLVEPWELLDEARKRHFRGTAFAIHENTTAIARDAMISVAAELEAVLASESTPQRWMPGLQQALRITFDTIESRDALQDIRAEIPDTLPEDFDSEDPYADIVAGQMDPQTWCETQCEETHANGWVCSRPPHPSHWKHWDADRDLPEPYTPGMIHVTWYDSNDALESVAPILSIDDED